MVCDQSDDDDTHFFISDVVQVGDAVVSSPAPSFHCLNLSLQIHLLSLGQTD